MATYELVIDNAKMQIHCNDPEPLPTTVKYRLEPIAVNDFDDGPVSYGDVWNDDDDGTYAPIQNSGTPDSRGSLIQTEPTSSDAYSGGEIVGLTVHFRASANGDDRAQLLVMELDRPSMSRIFWMPGNSSEGGISDLNDGYPFDFSIPNDNVIRDYTSTVDAVTLDENGWDAIDEIREDLAVDECQLYFWTDAYYDGGTYTYYPLGEIRIHEAWIIVEAVS